MGHPIYEPAASDPFVQAVERAVAAGIVVIVSAGNLGKHPETGVVGYGGITSPANAPSAITAGAVDIDGTVTRADDTVPDYSSRGPTWYDAYPKPDLVAPGSRLVAAAALRSWLYKTYPQFRVSAFSDDDDDNGAYYLRLSGTSMSAAVTSGVVALMLERSVFSY